MRNNLRSALVLAVLLGIVVWAQAGTAVPGEPVSSWPQARYGASRTAYNPDEVVMNARAVRRARPLLTIPFEWRVGSVLADEGDLFVLWGPAFEGADLWEAHLSRYGMDGTERWTGPGSNASFAISNGRVSVRGAGPFSGCGSSSVQTTGAESLWSGNVEAAWAIDATTVFTFDQLYDEEHDWCGSTNVRARDAQTGEERWNVPGAAGVVTEGGVAYLGSPDGLVLALDEATGEELWRLDRSGKHASVVASADGLLYLSIWQQGVSRSALLAVDEATHEVAWRRPVQGTLFAMSLSDGRAVFSTGTEVIAVRTADGSVRWRTTLDRVYELRGAAGVVYAYHYPQDRWVALRGHDGSTIRTFDVSGLIVANGRIITNLGREVTIWGPPTA
jgi:outer membrane protein assembly factor BamB